MDRTKPPDAAERMVFGKAFREGAYQTALRAYQRGQIVRAIHMIEAEGYAAKWSDQPKTAHEWAVEVVGELDRLIKQDGEEVSYKLAVARQMISSVALLQWLFENRTHKDGRDPGDILAELVLAAINIGISETVLSSAEGGLFDEYMTLRVRHMETQESRRRGAMATNENRAQKRDKVLPLAKQILSTNPTLSNGELAHKLKAKHDLESAPRTLEGWIRKWRETGELPPVAQR